MSDISQGEGWWQASDNKWYPPEQHPDHQPPPTLAAAAPEPAPLVQPPAPIAPPPTAPPPITAPPTPIASTSGAGKWIIVGALSLAVLALGAFLLFGRDDGKTNTVAVSSSSSSSSSSTSSSSASSSSSSTVALTEAELRERLITAKELGSNFADDTFVRNTNPKTLCGTRNPDQVIPPTIDVGSAAKTKTGISFQQEIAVFDDAAAAGRAFDLDVGGFSCSQGTSVDSSSSTQTFTFERAQDRSADLAAEKAIEIDFQSNGFHGQLFFVRTNAAVVQFAFIALDTADTSTVSEASSVVLHALDRLAS